MSAYIGARGALSIGDDCSPTNLLGVTPGPFLNALSRRAFWLPRNRIHDAHVLFYERDK
jgi:hypothetical protein